LTIAEEFPGAILKPNRDSRAAPRPRHTVGLVSSLVNEPRPIDPHQRPAEVFPEGGLMKGIHLDDFKGGNAILLPKILHGNPGYDLLLVLKQKSTEPLFFATRGDQLRPGHRVQLRVRLFVPPLHTIQKSGKLGGG